MLILELLHFFFFSSRRRHTRFDCDWSSDVCSSDLSALTIAYLRFRRRPSVGLRGEGEFHVFGFVSRDGDIGSLSAIGLMPGSDRVLSGRQIRQLEIAAVLAYVIVIR